MSNKSSLTKTCWQEVRKQVKLVDAELAQIIDDINPSNDLPLYIAEYPYGEIIDDGVFYYPDENGELRPLADGGLSREARDDFEYAGEATPTGMVLEKTIELFTESMDSITPFGIYSRGDWFALSTRLSESKSFFPSRLTCISSGVRSIYMLPKIGDSFHHKNLRKLLNRCVDAPKSLLDNWHTFKELCNNGLSDKWVSKILLLSSTWTEKIKTDHLWSQLKLYLVGLRWKRFEYDVSRPYFDVAFSEIQNNRNLRKIDPYLIDTAKHIFRILAGGSPGFSVDNTDESAPISFIQNVYLDMYGLGKYYPYIFTPTYFCPHKSRSPVYYSFQVPTTLQFSPKTRNNLTTIAGLREVKRVIEIFSDELQKVQTKLGNHEFSSLLNSMFIEFFHDKPDHEDLIRSSKSLPEYDSRLIEANGLEFAYSGPFLRGCVLLGPSG